MKTLWMLLASLLLAACGDGSGTGGESIVFSLGFEAMPPEGESLGRFTTARGWEVELEEARMALGPLYLYTRAAPTASWLEKVRSAVVPVAHAHSGFDNYDGGQVRGELLDPVVLDLLKQGVQGEASLSGVAGPVRSVSLELASHEDAPLSGGHAFMKGVARKDGVEVPFAGVLELADDPKVRRVTGLPTSLELERGAQVVVELHPIHWFTRLNFEELPPAGRDGFHPIEPETEPYRAWTRGVGAFGSFVIR